MTYSTYKVLGATSTYAVCEVLANLIRKLACVKNTHRASK